MFRILFLLVLVSTSTFAQSLYVSDNMESPAGFRGTSSMINSMFIGDISTALDNPPNYPMYASPDTCYMVKGIGLGSSAAEVDTFTYPNLPVIANRNYEIRFKVASFGLSPGTNTAAGVDGSSDTLEFQYRVANSGWFRDCKIIGNSNSMWSFDGAIGTGAKLAISRNANTTPNIYVSNAGNPITSVAIRLFQGTYTTIQIRFISKLNGSGETWMLDDVEVWDVTPLLPVELTEFKGIVENGTVKLYWETASELNNDYFEVLKSTDGINYYTVDYVSGNGTINQICKYTYTDLNYCDDIVYYKLKQVDYDGISKEYDPISIYCKPIVKKLIKIVNQLGQEVNENYNGLKLYIYEK